MSVNGFRFDGEVHKYNYDSLDNKPVPDKTLTDDGGFADSKSVGDAITTMQHTVDDAITTMQNTVDEAATTMQHTVDEAITTMQHMVGSPLVANSASDMTDITKIYVYTGSEVGYENGDWYYFDGTLWVDGGVYNAVAIDLDTITSVVGTSLILG